MKRCISSAVCISLFTFFSSYSASAEKISQTQKVEVVKPIKIEGTQNVAVLSLPTQPRQPQDFNFDRLCSGSMTIQEAALCLQNSQRWANWWSVVASGFSAIISAVSVTFSSVSLWIALRSNRAWVTPENCEVTKINVGERSKLKIKFTWKNSGKSPARISHFFYQYRLVNAGDEVDFRKKECEISLIRKAILGPDESVTIDTFCINSSEYEEVLSGEKVLQIHSRVEYKAILWSFLTQESTSTQVIKINDGNLLQTAATWGNKFT